MVHYTKISEYDPVAILSSEEIWKGFPKVEGKSVFIKPNLVTPPTSWDWQSIVDVSVVEAVVEKCLKDGAADITVGCCGFKGQWDRTVELSGYDRLVKDYGVSLICVQEGPNYHKYTLKRFEEKSDYMSLYGTKISDFFLQAEVRINIAKLKVHSMAMVTGAIKNTMGVISPKGSMHPNGSIEIIHKRLRDLYALMNPYVDWSLVDGIIGSEFNEQYGVPRKADVLFSGDDMFDVDVFGAAMMGIKPMKVPYLRNIRKVDQKTIGVLPPDDMVIPFELPMYWKDK